MNIRPVDLPELRDEVAGAFGRYGVDTYHDGLHRDEKSRLNVPGMNPAQRAKSLAEAQVKRLTEATLFYVSGDMSELAIAAGPSLPEFAIVPEDLPSLSGFIYFEKPIFVADVVEVSRMDMPIVAASWSQWDGSTGSRGGFWIDWYAEAGPAITQQQKRKEISKRDARVTAKRSRLILVGPGGWPYSTEPGPIPEDFPEAARAVLNQLAILKAAWLLMMQPIARVETRACPPRSTHWLRNKDRETPEVRVITLRRPASTGNGESDREYHHQWIVRGHWRQQWYPSRQVNRPVWIAPHVKGPEGAPMLGGEKVYAWSR